MSSPPSLRETAAETLKYKRHLYRIGLVRLVLLAINVVVAAWIVWAIVIGELVVVLSDGDAPLCPPPFEAFETTPGGVWFDHLDTSGEELVPVDARTRHLELLGLDPRTTAVDSITYRTVESCEGLYCNRDTAGGRCVDELGVEQLCTHPDGWVEVGPYISIQYEGESWGTNP